MLGRTFGSAALAIAIGFSVSAPARAQNLEAGKSPAQIFNGACAACHKSPRGLVKSVPPSSLPGFLRQHYTTSGDMARVLSGYLLASGGVDSRPAATERPRRGREARPVAAPEPAPAPAPASNGWWPFRSAAPAPQAAPEAAPPSSKSGSKRKAKAKKSKAAPQDDKPESAGSPAAKPEPAVTPAPEPKVTEPKGSETGTAARQASEPKPSESKPSEPEPSGPKASEPKSPDSKAD